MRELEFDIVTQELPFFVPIVWRCVYGHATNMARQRDGKVDILEAGW
jgi:hypothetical protein